jgi:uncharacterized protein YkwD
MKHRVLLLRLTCLALFINLISFSPAPGGLVDDILDQTNKFRKSRGLQALIKNEDLNSIAQKHSVDMANGRVGFGHSGFDQRYNLAKKEIKGVSLFAENVAYGVTSGKEVVDLWKNSPGHRRNMLGRFKYIGIGTAKDRQGRIYFTQVFAD